jgi:hypothetical protein
MGLREIFSSAAIDKRAKERLNRKLTAWADKLPRKIGKYRKKEWMEQVMFIGYPGYDVKTLSGYRRLHEMCAAENIQIKNENRRYSGDRYPAVPAIVIDLSKPYRLSTAPGIHKMPVWVQPTLPGF